MPQARTTSPRNGAKAPPEPVPDMLQAIANLLAGRWVTSEPKGRLPRWAEELAGDETP